VPKIDAKASIEKRMKSVINTAYFAGIHLLVLAQRRRDALEANRFDSSAGGVGTLQDKKKIGKKGTFSLLGVSICTGFLG